MGHVAFGVRQAVLAARREAAGEPRPELDWQAMNETAVAAAKGRPPADQRTELDAAHAEVLAILHALPHLDPSVVGVCGCLRQDTYEHYDEHTADIRAWRARVGL